MNKVLTAFALLFAVLFGIDLWLLGTQNSFAAMHASIPDEALMFENIRGMLIFHFSSGYGPVFWSILVGLLKLFPAINLFIFRGFFCALKYAAIFACTKALWDNQKKFAAFFFLGFVALMPAFYFYGKIISPEFVLLLLGAMTFGGLLYDKGRLGWGYCAALVLSVMGLLVKISFLPLLAVIPLYGVIHVALTKKENTLRAIVFHGLKLALFYGSLFVALSLVCPVEDIMKSIKEIMGIVPDSAWTEERLLLAWNRDEESWDQILIQGFRVGFMPFIVAATIGFPCFIYQVTISWRKNIVHACILLATSLMLMQTIIHGIAASWYLFCPVFLSCAVFSDVIAQTLLRFKQTEKVSLILCSTLFVVLSFVSVPQISKNIGFKYAANQQLAHHDKLRPEIMAYLEKEHPTLKTGNLDILIPSDNNELFYPDDALLLPLRLTLRHKTEKRWKEPDFLLVNRSTHNDRSPLLAHVVKEAIENYTMEKSFDDVDLYIRTKSK